MATWAEKAKIELSQKEDAVVSLPETELGVRDQAGEEIYIDIAIDRKRLRRLIAPKVEESIQSAQNARKGRLSPHDVERMCFVGGPTTAKPLRKGCLRAWHRALHRRKPDDGGCRRSSGVRRVHRLGLAEPWPKSARGALSAGGGSISRSTTSRARRNREPNRRQFGGRAPAGIEFQIDSLDTGWSSGRAALKDGASVELSLTKPGDNIFKVFVFDSNGAPVALREDKIVIARPPPASTRFPRPTPSAWRPATRLAGALVLDYLVREGDQLPKKGKKSFKAGDPSRPEAPGRSSSSCGKAKSPIPSTTTASSACSRSRARTSTTASSPQARRWSAVRSARLRQHPVGSLGAVDQRFIQRAQLTTPARKARSTTPIRPRIFRSSRAHTLERLEEMASKVDDPRLEQARETGAGQAPSSPEADPETAKQAMDNVQGPSACWR